MASRSVAGGLACPVHEVDREWDVLHYFLIHNSWGRGGLVFCLKGQMQWICLVSLYIRPGPRRGTWIGTTPGQGNNSGNEFKCQHQINTLHGVSLVYSPSQGKRSSYCYLDQAVSRAARFRAGVRNRPRNFDHFFPSFFFDTSFSLSLFLSYEPVRYFPTTIPNDLKSRSVS